MIKINERVSDLNYKDVIAKEADYNDQKFPRTNKSFGDDEDMQDAIKRHIGWRRARDIASDYDVFNGIDVDDVVQAELGSCYFLSAITGLAEKPNRVLKLFLVKDKNKAGCYAVQLYVAGAPRTIIVDEWFPAFGSQWAFTHSHQHEMWVMVLEKAWAKIHGTYSSIIGGDSRESLSALTGAPTMYYIHEKKTKEEMWTILREADKRDYIMSTGGKKEIKGIVRAHAYSMLKAIEVNVSHDKSVKLVQLRNPWGCSEWTGDWSDNSTLWTPELRRQLNHVSKDDGTFFMAFDDFYTVFYHSFVCQWVENYLHSSLIQEQYEACVAFQLTSSTKGFFSVHQMTPRMTGTKGTKLLVLEIYAYQSKRLELVIDPVSSNALGVATAEVSLPSGLYVLHAYFHNKDIPSVKYLCFSVYASKAVDLIPLPGKTTVSSISYSELVKAAEKNVQQLNIKVIPKVSAVGTLEACGNDHRLEYIGTEDGQYRCDYCNAQREKSIGRYFCRLCRYDVCPECRPGPGALRQEKTRNEEQKAKKEKKKEVRKTAIPMKETKQSTVRQITTCNRGHTLQGKTPRNLIEAIFLCTVCGRLAEFGPNNWVCEPCRYFLCTNCKEPQVGVAPPPTLAHKKKVANQCARGHPLYVDFAKYENNAYYCDICERQGTCSAGRWRCPLCNYDVCTVCRTLTFSNDAEVRMYNKAPQKSEPLIPQVITACNNGHKLFFSSFNYLSGEYLCNKCYVQYECQQGRWVCLGCEYDICPKCRQPPADLSEPVRKCKGGHYMTYSEIEYLHGEFYRCNVCHKAKKARDGRWWCPACPYDLCEACSKKEDSGEHVEFPVALSDEERHCKDKKHQFVKGTSSEATYICLKDQQKVNAAEGLFKCIKCGMTLCPTCAPNSGIILLSETSTETSDESHVIEPSAGASVPLDDTPPDSKHCGCDGCILC